METSSFMRPKELWQSLELRAGQTVVHLGAGPGFYVIPAAAIVGPTGKVIAVDILTDMLAEITSKAAREHLENIQTVRANIENTPGTPLPEKSADWVLVANILHQAAPDKVFAEATRLIKSKGHVVVIEWDAAASPFGPPAASRVPRPRVEELAEAAGLQTYKRFTASPYHYGLVLNAI